jgi:hypothetical protein
MEKIQIRDKHPGSATLSAVFLEMQVQFAGLQSLVDPNASDTIKHEAKKIQFWPAAV